MDEEIRSGGGAVVRRDALTRRYREANNEEEVETALSDELTAQGWSVIRQVWCRPMNEANRRIDIYASKSVNAGRVNVDLTLGIELKYDSGLSEVRQAYSQIRRYRESFLWCTDDGTILAPPMWLCFTNRALLGGDDRGFKPSGLFDRMMWEIGASVLSRGWAGNLEMNVRVPQMVQRKPGVFIMSTADPRVSLTKWRTERSK